MTEHRPTDPAVRAGIYKTLADVPDRHRFYHHATVYEGEDVWKDYLDTEVIGEDIGDSRRSDIARFGNRWKEHMDNQGRHHALATPADVESYAAYCLDQNAERTAVNYWTNIERFYRWMRWHTDHPHRYNPFVMAAIDGAASRILWDHIMGLVRE